MLSILLTLAACLPAAQEGKLLPPGSKPQVQAQDPLDAELNAIAREYNLARSAYDKRLDELRKQGEARPESKLAHPSVAFWPRIESLGQRGSPGALLWMALQFANAHPELSAAERDRAWGPHLLAAVDAGAKAPLARDLARSFTVLYLDAPPPALDEAVASFVQKTAERELAADALYRASIAKRRGTQQLASPKAAEFGKRLAAEYADTSAARQSRGEVEVGLAIGKQAPEFTAKDADGVAFKLSDYRGKVVVLDFWGFW
jgi:hypothetical protein